MVAHPEADIGGAKPVTFKPPFELVQVTDEDQKVHFLLRKDKVYFQMTDYISITEKMDNGGVLASIYIDQFIDLGQVEL